MNCPDKATATSWTGGTDRRTRHAWTDTLLSPKVVCFHPVKLYGGLHERKGGTRRRKGRVKASKCANLRYLLQTLSTSATMTTLTTRTQQFDSRKEVTENNGMDAEMLGATDVPASSAMHIEPPEVDNVMKSRDSHHSPWSCPLAAKIST